MARFIWTVLIAGGWAGRLAIGDDCVVEFPGAAAIPTQQMQARVDELLAESCRQAGVEPAPQAGDAEFLRRVNLDLTGVIPTAAEVRAFLADAQPGKRTRLIDRLVVSPAHATHLAAEWRKLLLPQDAAVQQFAGAAALEERLRSQFASNIRYDNLVADLLVSTGRARESGSALFYTALELKPEELASATARIFLGVQIGCAQCHDHPFDKWKQEDFWGYAAFFARLQRQPGRQLLDGELVDLPEGEVRFPETERVVLPRYLGAAPAPVDADVNRRRQLALWIVSRENDYFARATVNRAWSRMFGRGLVEPVDDLGQHNPPSHPALLDELAAYFRATGYDLREFFRMLAGTRAYQLSSRRAPGDETPPELFARMPIRPLTADQLYSCLTRATRRPSQAPGMDGIGQDPQRLEFLLKFQSSAAEFQVGIPQVLTLMNGSLMSQITSASSSGLLQALEAPFFSDADRVEALTLAVLSRPPSAEEQAAWGGLLAAAADPADKRAALADLLWATLNSVEFTFNH